MRTERGRCFCSAIKAEMSGEPFWICYDHDDDCRRAIGGPLTIWVGYRPDDVRYNSGNPRSFSKTKGVTPYFCGDCGTSIAYVDEGLLNAMYFCIAFMDNRERFPPDPATPAPEAKSLLSRNLDGDLQFYRVSRAVNATRGGADTPDMVQQVEPT
jgi:hypothetical protein